ncbi:MAG: 3-phosphoshikimate 1-carboxyvinyltransferase [Pseudomonadales bacterium]
MSNIHTKKEKRLFNPKIIRDDPFIYGLLQRMPEDVGKEFTEVQLRAIYQALTFNQQRIHPVDFRGAIGIPGFSWYFVFLAGTDHRRTIRNRAIMFRKFEILFVLITLATLAFLGITFSYIVKSMLNINLFSDFSLGLWDWIIGK